MTGPINLQWRRHVLYGVEAYFIIQICLKAPTHAPEIGASLFMLYFLTTLNPGCAEKLWNNCMLAKFT